MPIPRLRLWNPQIPKSREHARLVRTQKLRSYHRCFLDRHGRLKPLLKDGWLGPRNGMHRQVSNSASLFRKCKLPHHRGGVSQHVGLFKAREPQAKIKLIRHDHSFFRADLGLDGRCSQRCIYCSRSGTIFFAHDLDRGGADFDSPRAAWYHQNSSFHWAPATLRPRRLARPRTPPFHGDNTGSNPVGDANATRVVGVTPDHSGESMYLAGTFLGLRQSEATVTPSELRDA